MAKYEGKIVELHLRNNFYMMLLNIMLILLAMLVYAITSNVLFVFLSGMAVGFFLVEFVVALYILYLMKVKKVKASKIVKMLGY